MLPTERHSTATTAFLRKARTGHRYAPNLFVWYTMNDPVNGGDPFGPKKCKLTCIKWQSYWEANGYSSDAECALAEYHKHSVDEPGWWLIGLPIAWGVTIYDTALFYRQQAMCNKQECVAWQ
jgi:hypothetical protein